MVIDAEVAQPLVPRLGRRRVDCPVPPELAGTRRGWRRTRQGCPLWMQLRLVAWSAGGLGRRAGCGRLDRFAVDADDPPFPAAALAVGLPRGGVLVVGV